MSVFNEIENYYLELLTGIELMIQTENNIEALEELHLIRLEAYKKLQIIERSTK